MNIESEYVEFEEIESESPQLPMVDEVIHEVEVEEIPHTEDAENTNPINMWSQFVSIFDKPRRSNKSKF